MRWYEAINHCQQQGIAYVLVTLLQDKGSTPRDAGTKMVVTADSCYDTIGGGNLEFKVTHNARNLLIRKDKNTSIESFPLSTKTGQCCGGATEVLYEIHASHSQQVAVFGAGHVAQSLVPILAQLPLQILWIESRAEYLPKKTPSNVTLVHNEEPDTQVTGLNDNCWLVVMTHLHQLDFDIVHKALRRPNLPYVGMIGSKTKAKRFHYRLSQRGISESQLARFVSPIGDLSIPGKRPVEVSVSIAAQLIQMLDAAGTGTGQTTPTASGITRKPKETNRELG